MNIYHCKLVYKGVVRESFLRRGRDEQDVLQGLNMFVWPKGHWVIE